MFALTGMKVDAYCQRGSRHWHKGVRFVDWVQRNSADALMHRVQQERAHTYPQTHTQRIYPTGDVVYDTAHYLKQARKQSS